MHRVTLLFLLASSLLFSEKMEEYPFLGLTISTQSTSIAKSSELKEQTETAIGFQYGKQTLKWRTIFAFEYVPDIYRSFSIEIDKILSDQLFGYPEIRPYIGGTVGLVTYLGGDDTVSTYFYGANAGLIVYATDNIDADVSFQYKQIQDFEDITGIYGASLGLHYFY